MQSTQRNLKNRPTTDECDGQNSANEYDDEDSTVTYDVGAYHSHNHTQLTAERNDGEGSRPAADRLAASGWKQPETVTVSELREIAREWVAANDSYADPDDVREYGVRRGVPGYGVSHGNVTRALELSCIDGRNPDDEIPVTAQVIRNPMNAPRYAKTVRGLINDINQNGGEDSW